LWLHSLKVAQLLRSAACLHTNQSRSYLNHLVDYYYYHYYCYSIIFLSFLLSLTYSTYSLFVYRIIVASDHTQGHTHSLTHSQSVEILWPRGRPIAEASIWQHIIFRRQTSLTPEGLEPAIPARKWPQTHSLDRAVTGNGSNV